MTGRQCQHRMVLCLQEHGGGVNVLALCAGVGGLELGVKLANPAARCVCYVEGEAFVGSVLVNRMEEKALDEAPIWSDVRTFEGKLWRGKVDCITGGYPCQPFSLAGPMLGSQDPRHLWPHIRRIVEEVQPDRCFFENVANHLRMGFQEVHDDLRQMGYRVAAGLFTAAEVGATHQRERLFILGIARSGRWDKELSKLVNLEPSSPEDEVGNSVSDEVGWGSVPRVPSRAGDEMVVHTHRAFPPLPDDLEGWREAASDAQPTVLGSIDGASVELDRIRACGNAVVPLVAAYAWRVLEAGLAI